VSFVSNNCDVRAKQKIEGSRRKLFLVSAFSLLFLVSSLTTRAAIPKTLILISGWQLQDAAKVVQSGAVIASPNYKPVNWFAVTAPGSVSPIGQVARTIELKAGASTRLSLTLGELHDANQGLSLPAIASLALNRPVTVSSVADDSPGVNAVDGDEGTRWSSAYTDDEWISIDLGATKRIATVKLTWETANVKAFKIQVSPDAANGTDVYSTTNGNGGIEQIPLVPKRQICADVGTAERHIMGLFTLEIRGQWQ
jgi:hypothetical protein